MESEIVSGRWSKQILLLMWSKLILLRLRLSLGMPLTLAFRTEWVSEGALVLVRQRRRWVHALLWVGLSYIWLALRRRLRW